VGHKIHETMITPGVEMAFRFEDNAYDMYNTYADKVEFNIKKSTTKY
jgi:hypothetical protein